MKIRRLRAEFRHVIAQSVRNEAFQIHRVNQVFRIIFRLFDKPVRKKPFIRKKSIPVIKIFKRSVDTRRKKGLYIHMRRFRVFRKNDRLFPMRKNIIVRFLNVIHTVKKFSCFQKSRRLRRFNRIFRRVLRSRTDCRMPSTTRSAKERCPAAAENRLRYGNPRLRSDS